MPVRNHQCVDRKRVPRSDSGRSRDFPSGIGDPMRGTRALVGLLNNPVVPSIIRYAPELVEYVDVIPDRLWYDFEGRGESGGRFHRVVGAIEELKQCAAGR